MQSLVFKYRGHRYTGPAAGLQATFAAVVYMLTGIETRAFRAARRAARAAWIEHANGLQAEIDTQAARGYGFRYCDGRRVDR